MAKTEDEMVLFKKLQSNGKFSFSVVIPLDWVEDNKLKRGSEVKMTVGRQAITIIPWPRKKL